MSNLTRSWPSILAVLFVLPALPVSAQIGAEFEKVLANSSEQQMVIAAAKQSSVVLENQCAEGKFVIASKVAIIEAPVFDQAGLLRSGIWKQVVDYTG
jgi:hypothetical protein